MQATQCDVTEVQSLNPYRLAHVNEGPRHIWIQLNVLGWVLNDLRLQPDFVVPQILFMQ